MRRVGTLTVSVWTLCLAVAGCTSTIHGTAVAGQRPPRSAPQTQSGLAGLLLSLDEMRQVMKLSDLASEQVWTQPDPRGVFEPAGCVGAVFSGMAASYDGSGYRDFYEVRDLDSTPAEDRYHWVDQGVATFESPEAAKAFVTKEVGQWRQCAKQPFRYAFPDPSDWGQPYVIGDTVDSGCVTTLNNVIDGDRHYDDIRVLAAKSDVVVDLQFTGFDLTDEPSTVVAHILDRITSGGRDCAFWG